MLDNVVIMLSLCLSVCLSEDSIVQTINHLVTKPEPIGKSNTHCVQVKMCNKCGNITCRSFGLIRQLLFAYR